MKSSRIPVVLSLLAVFAFFVRCGGGEWTAWERGVINKSDSLMYVTVINADSAILRSPSKDLNEKELKSEELKTLMGKMLHTVKHPSQDGVGIAAPQVGINRRVIWVQRFDKAGEPFECYANVHLDSLYGEITHGPEGCLSVPPMRGIVPRYSGVVVRYVNPRTGEPCTEQVEGYTAIIFQHECDHLDGRLYIDRADSVFTSESWIQERGGFSYIRPEWWTVLQQSK